ncbi:hypothetical protein EDB83DRAFT_2553815 [Lactarius deliciosus]|nr:hypothetical protein EDB83DRAFT_2553815 [Lactarius deliciosus]
MEPKDREEAKGRVSEFSGNFTHSAKGLKPSVQERFWLAQAEKTYLSRTQDALGMIKVFRTIPSVLRGTNRLSFNPQRIVDETIEIGSQREGGRSPMRHPKNVQRVRVLFGTSTFRITTAPLHQNVKEVSFAPLWRSHWLPSRRLSLAFSKVSMPHLLNARSSGPSMLKYSIKGQGLGGLTHFCLVPFPAQYWGSSQALGNTNLRIIGCAVEGFDIHLRHSCIFSIGTVLMRIS